MLICPVKLWVGLGEAGKTFPIVLKMMDKTVSSLDQIFNFDVTSLYRKQMLERTCFIKEKAQAPGFRVQGVYYLWCWVHTSAEDWTVSIFY